jgi:hypothetical protein
VLKCDNKTVTGGKPCMDEGYLAQNFDSIYMTVTHLDFDTAPKNYEEPFRPFQQSEMIQFGTGLYKTFYNIRTPVRVRTDSGFVFEEFVQQDSYSYARTDTVVNNKAEDPSFGVAQYIVIHNKKAEIYTRSYAKIQTLLANIGGIVKAIFVFAQIIAVQSSYCDYKEYMMNLLFNFGESNLKKDKTGAYNTSARNPLKANPSKKMLSKAGTSEYQLSEIKLNSPPKTGKKKVEVDTKKPAAFVKNQKKYSTLGTPMKMSFFQKIGLRMCSRNDAKMKIYDTCDRVIDYKTSIDHMIASINDFEKFSRVAMSDQEQNLFQSLRSLYVEEHQEILTRRTTKSQKYTLTQSSEGSSTTEFINRMNAFMQL